MQERFSSSNDPLFIMHHGFIDLIWETWRQTRQTRRQRESDYPADNGECMPEWHFSYNFMPLLEPMTNLDAMSNAYTDGLYEYAPRPGCPGGASHECQSEFLFCDIHSEPLRPHCSVKIKLGGNCAAFEWSRDEVCYEGRCLEGICSLGKERRKGLATWRGKGREGERSIDKSFMAAKFAM